MIKKITLILLGILCIVLFELSLHLAGKIYLHTRSLEPSQKFEKLICCIGDSHTFGVGTSYGYSYPKQLETLLNLNNSHFPETIRQSSLRGSLSEAKGTEANSKKRLLRPFGARNDGYRLFNVVNLGIPGSSTRDQIERLADFLSKNRVELVILLTGRNNYYEVKKWKDTTFVTNATTKIKTMRIYKIMQYALYRVFKVGIGENINAWPGEIKYEDYMRKQLLKAKALCGEHGARLLLISYYNSQYEAVEKIAGELGILYFNLSKDFLEAIPEEDIINFVSRDSSHMNLYGYNIFAELLYEKMFLHRKALNLKLAPLSKKIDKDSFKENTAASYLRYVLGKSIFYEN